jgi:ribosomal-protein-alanine N-acetyltransferase
MQPSRQKSTACVCLEMLADHRRARRTDEIRMMAISTLEVSPLTLPPWTQECVGILPIVVVDASGGKDRREVETVRLRLRPFAREDLAEHIRLYRDPEVTRYLAGGPFAADEVAARSRRAVERFVTHWEAHGFGVWAVLERASGRLIGQCGLNRLPDRPEVEVLYALERSRWGRGLGPEAARAALRYGFEVAGLDRIVAVVRPENAASRRVLEKLGMSCEGDVDVYGTRAAYYALDRATFTGA